MHPDEQGGVDGREFARMPRDPHEQARIYTRCS